MKYIAGLILATFGYIMANIHLEQHLGDYWDYVAFYVVFFGTIAVMTISFPADSFKVLSNTLSQKFLKLDDPIEKTASKCALIATKGQALPESGKIEDRLLNDGLELISLGFEREKIEEILAQRFHNHARKMNLLISWLKRNSKYPPAFGLSGTVLGLIHLMRGISAGIDAKEVGIRMAVALVATLYGLIISNLILNPMGEWLTEELKRDELKADMAINSVMSLSQSSNVLEVQEMLNSYLEIDKRMNLVSQTLTSEQFN